MVTVCFDENGDKYTNSLGENFYFVCFDSATRLAVAMSAFATSAFLMV